MRRRCRPDGSSGAGYNSRFENDSHIVRAGLNYKFGAVGGWWLTRVPRYRQRKARHCAGLFLRRACERRGFMKRIRWVMQAIEHA